MPARPIVSEAAETLYGALGPWARADTDSWQLLLLCEAFAGKLIQPLNNVVMDTDTDPGWSVVTDVDRAPEAWLPWLGQFVGVRIPGEITDLTAKRDWVRAASGFKRCTSDAIRTAAAVFLVEPKTVILVQRADGHPKKFRVITQEEETPNSAKVLRSILTQKPAGFILDYQVATGVPSYDWIRTEYTHYSDLPLAYYDYDDMRGRRGHGFIIHYADVPTRFSTYQTIKDTLASYKLLREQHT